MGKRFAVALIGIILGGIVGWVIASLTGWTFSVIIGILAGGIGFVVWAERRRAIPTVDELHRPQPISLTDYDDRSGHA